MGGVLAAEIKSAEGGHYKGDRGLGSMTSKVPSMWQTMWAPLRLRLRLVRKWSKGMGRATKLKSTIVQMFTSLRLRLIQA